MLELQVQELFNFFLTQFFIMHAQKIISTQ